MIKETEGKTKKIDLWEFSKRVEKEAEKKRAEAVKYDPSLTEKAMQPAKRGRGRPKGTTKEAIAAKSEATTTSESVSSEA